MSQGLPKQWTSCEIGEVAQVVGGATPPSKDPTNFDSDGGIPWITPADLSGYKETYIGRGVRNLSAKGFAACSAAMLPAGTVLFSSRAPVGYVAIAANPVCTNQGFKSFVLPQGLDSRFVYYYLRHIRPIAEERATGTTFKELSGAAASRLPVEIAPTNEQKRIADKLDAVLARVDACRERLDRVPDILKRFRQAVLAAAVSGKLTEDWRGGRAEPLEHSRIAFDDDSVSVPSTWSLVRLTELIDPVRPLCYGVVQPGAEVEAGIPLIRVQDLHRGSVLVEELRTVSSEIDDQYRRSRVRSDDLLVSVVGTIGRLALVPPGVEANIARAIARIACKDGVNPRWIYIWLSCDTLQWWLTKSAREVARKTLNLSELGGTQIALPSHEEQAEIIRRVETLFTYADRLEARYAAARVRVAGLTPALLDKAFRGELVPQDPRDEPASVLLERIRAARAAAPVKSRRGRTTRKAKMTKPTRESVKEIIARMPDDQFTFDDLRGHVAGDYESLKGIVFELLAEPNPSLRQMFDTSAEALQFVRVTP
ncbi:MAG: restriction endonuclease subunit S [Chromatiaceae bacterium]|nr:restriction endonuclease subunit S [Chromatiaceae bacterium]